MAPGIGQDGYLNRLALDLQFHKISLMRAKLALAGDYRAPMIRAIETPPGKRAG